MPIMKIRIGSREIDATQDDAAVDGFKYSAEVSGNPKEKRMQNFYPRMLAGVTGEMFPDACDLLIYDVRSSFNKISFICIQKLNNSCKACLSMSFNFVNWDLPESLGSFIDRYVAGIKGVPIYDETTSTRSEYGYDVGCTISINGSEDIYKAIVAAEELFESKYRNLLMPPKYRDEKYGEQRFHWWIRYVVVPIVCSGTIATVIAKHFLR